MNTIKFIHISGDKVKITYDCSDLQKYGDGDILRLEYGHKGKLLNAAIIKRNGKFEPSFTLVASDPMAAPFVAMYGEMLGVIHSKEINANPEKIVSAKAAAKTFHDWQKK